MWGSYPIYSDVGQLPKTPRERRIVPTFEMDVGHLPNLLGRGAVIQFTTSKTYSAFEMDVRQLPNLLGRGAATQFTTRKTYSADF